MVVEEMRVGGGITWQQAHGRKCRPSPGLNVWGTACVWQTRIEPVSVKRQAPIKKL
jgi:hypothetical protein